MKLSNKLIFISAQPHDPYFLWQIEVQIVSFRKHGISDKMHILVWHSVGSKLINSWELLQQKYPETHIYLYENQGINQGLYIPQLRPHILKQHFKKYKEELKDKVFFYHDSDILFNYLPDFNSLLEDTICWQSDTSHYLDYNYLRRKEEEGGIPENEAIGALALIGRVSVETIKSYAGKTGGAQCILKNIDNLFWEDIERMVLAIREDFYYNIPGSVNKRYFASESAGFQSWCADMWALNFALWSRNIRTDVTPELDFSWATDTAETYNKKPIYHNAGVVSQTSDNFFKGAWIHKSPIGKKFSVDPNTANYYYAQAIMNVI